MVVDDGDGDGDDEDGVWVHCTLLGHGFGVRQSERPLLLRKCDKLGCSVSVPQCSTHS
jgi:hypothetical protein